MPLLGHVSIATDVAKKFDWDAVAAIIFGSRLGVRSPPHQLAVERRGTLCYS